MKILDSRFHGNDKSTHILTFYESVKLEGVYSGMFAYRYRLWRYEAIDGVRVISFPTAVYEVTFLCVTRKKLVGDFSYRLNEIITGARNERPVDLRVGQF